MKEIKKFREFKKNNNEVLHFDKVKNKHAV